MQMLSTDPGSTINLWISPGKEGSQACLSSQKRSPWEQSLIGATQPPAWPSPHDRCLQKKRSYFISNGRGKWDWRSVCRAALSMHFRCHVLTVGPILRSDSLSPFWFSHVFSISISQKKKSAFHTKAHCHWFTTKYILHVYNIHLTWKAYRMLEG